MRSDYLFSSWFPYWWSEDQAADGGSWDGCTPVCNQVLEVSAGNILHCLFCSMDYVLGPHVKMLLTPVQTLIFFFSPPGISGFYLWPVQETAQNEENIYALLMPAIWWLILRYIFSWFLWYIQHHNPHMVIASLCIPVGVYLLLFRDLPQRLSLAEQHCMPGSSNHPH